VEGRTRNKNKVSELHEKHEDLKYQLEEMMVKQGNKEEEIACLNAQLLKANVEGPGVD